MNIFAQYMKDRQRRVAQLSILRWWISENLGKGFFGIGLGLYIGILWKNNFRLEIAIGLMIAGGLAMLLSYSGRPIEVHIDEKDKLNK